MEQKRFMLLITTEEGQSAYFYDTCREAECALIGAELLCAMAQLYERTLKGYCIMYEMDFSNGGERHAKKNDI